MTSVSTFDFERAAPPARKAGGGGRAFLLAASLMVASTTNAHAEVRFHNEAGGNYTFGVMSWRDIPFRTVVRQQFDFSCGSAAIATLLRFHYGREVSETMAFRAMYEAGDQAKIREIGFSMLDMKRYLESVGYRADGFRISLDRLAQMRVPAVALITRDGYRHFVVIKGMRDGRVLVGDPSRGLEIHDRKEFEGWWNGIALAIRSGPGAEADLQFDRESDWRPWAGAPDYDTLPPALDAAQLTRELPTLYQITPPSIINGALP
ncbi:MAG: C39 family peptidase [Alphaproteobacteria bacterium]|nr:C39 family peptidase [Alphaproteobacteria bacterium]